MSAANAEPAPYASAATTTAASAIMRAGPHLFTSLVPPSRPPERGQPPAPIVGVLPRESSDGGGPVAVERRVEAATLEQLVVRSLLDDPSVLEDDDQVGVADRRQAMRDDERVPRSCRFVS